MADAGARARRLLFLYASASLTLAPSAVQADLEFVPRNYSGEGNNIAHPAWGATGTMQVIAPAVVWLARAGSGGRGGLLGRIR